MIQYYDLSQAPATHDFCNWLARVEIERRNKKEPFVDIVFCLGQRIKSPRDHVYPLERKIWRVHNLLMPLARCLPSVRRIAIGEGKQTLHYVNCSEPVVTPILKAPAVAAAIAARYLRGKPKPVSITLRESEFEPTRNSNIEEWRKVIGWLNGHGYTPIYVPDGEALMLGQASDLFTQYAYSAAAMSPEVRLALYEQCVANLMTTGGPMVLALMSDVPLMAWKLIVPGIPCCTPKHMRMSAMSPSDYWGPYKKLFWSQDTFAEITGALQQWLPKMEERGIPIPDDVFSLREHPDVYADGEEKWKSFQAT